MPLREFFAIVRRRWMSIAALTIVCLIGAGVLSYTATPQYRTSAQVYFTLPYGNSAGDLSQGSTYTQSQVLTYAQMAKMPIVLDPVSKEVGHGLSSAAIGGKVSASVTPDTVIVKITASDASPALAAKIANSVAKHLGNAARDLAPKTSSDRASVDARTVGAASVPHYPFSPQKTRNFALALLGGLFLGVALAVLRELLDNRIKSRVDVEAITEAPVLGEIQADRNVARQHVVLRDHPGGVQAEAFRRVQTNLAFLAVDRKPLAAVITSALAKEGKSSIAVNLAIASAEAGARTLLIDADLRSPSIAGYMGLEGEVGLANVLVGQADFEEVVQTYDPDIPLDVLTSGPTPPNTGRLIGSDAMTALLIDLFGRYEVLLIDCAPLLPVTDAAVLAREVSGAIVITRVPGARRMHPFARRQGGASRHQFAEAVGSLEQLDADVLGVVLNGLRARDNAYYGYGHPVPPRRRWSRRRKPRAVGAHSSSQSALEPVDVELPIEDDAPRPTRSARRSAAAGKSVRERSNVSR